MIKPCMHTFYLTILITILIDYLDCDLDDIFIINYLKFSNHLLCVYMHCACVCMRACVRVWLQLRVCVCVAFWLDTIPYYCITFLLS